MRGKWGIKVVFLTGLVLCCFPIISNAIEQRHQADAVATYKKAAEKSEDKLERMLEDAKTYNAMLYQTDGMVLDGEEEIFLSDENYEKVLDISGTGVMGCLDIPKIQVELPIYHGTDNTVLSNGIGHLPGTSIPTGGENTHSVLTGHRGLPRSKLLVRLDEMKKGDLFFIHVGNDTLAYQVFDIRIIEPEDLSCLKILPGKDLVSLVTCTPYGINTHRLVVAGIRVGFEPEEYESIQAELPSAREITVTLLPFAFLIVAIGLLVKDKIYIKDRRGSKR